MKILFVASDPMEFTGILRHTAKARPAFIAVDWSRTGTLNGNEVLLIANGVGSSRAAAAVDAALQKFPAEAVVSTGFCGALEAKLAVADLVSATGIVQPSAASASSIARRSDASVADLESSAPPRLGGESSLSPRLCVSASKPQPLPAPICSVDHVVRTAEEKAQLRATGAAAVEMEAAGIASRAHFHNLPFYCVRAVTDLAGETLANDFNAALRADGHFDTMIILGKAFRHPGVRLPELLRLRSRCTKAARVLGDFFVDCRF